MRLDRQTGSGRREFGRLVLSSLAATARAELDERRARGQRLRARRTLHRLEELERQLERLDRGLPPLRAPWYARGGILAVVVTVWLGSLAALLAAVAVNGPSGVVVSVADAVMLLTTLAWFCVAVARRRPPPPDEGSLTPRHGR